MPDGSSDGGMTGTAQVHRLGDPELHFWLTRSVARVMGVNLSEAMARSLLHEQDYTAMVNTCRQCPNVGKCQEWLGQRHQRPAQAPAHCGNAERLTNLAVDLSLF